MDHIKKNRINIMKDAHSAHLIARAEGGYFYTPIHLFSAGLHIILPRIFNYIH